MEEPRTIVLQILHPTPELEAALGARAGDYLVWSTDAPSRVVLRRELADHGIALNAWASGAAELVTQIPPEPSPAPAAADPAASPQIARAHLRLHA